MYCICKANVSHSGENIAALWVWLNTCKSDDLRTKCIQHKVQESRKKYFVDLLVTIVATWQEVKLNVYFILISESSLYVLSYIGQYTAE